MHLMTKIISVVDRMKMIEMITHSLITAIQCRYYVSYDEQNISFLEVKHIIGNCLFQVKDSNGRPFPAGCRMACYHSSLHLVGVGTAVPVAAGLVY